MKIKSLVSSIALLAAMATVSLAGEVRLYSWEAYFGAASIKALMTER